MPVPSGMMLVRAELKPMMFMHIEAYGGPSFVRGGETNVIGANKRAAIEVQ